MREQRAEGTEKPGGACRGLVLAAGRGSRLPSDAGQPFPKVLRPVLGRPMVCWVLDTLSRAGVGDVTVVVGFGADQVRLALGDTVRYVLQEEQLGSGHAVACAAPRFRGFDGSLLVMCGDSPLFTARTVSNMIRTHTRSGAVATLAAAVLDDPTGYGRIVRDAEGKVAGVSEEKCASQVERSLREVNGGAYVFHARWLFDNIQNMALNEADEYNLTDIIRVAVEQGRDVATVTCEPEELLGVNSPKQLAAVEQILRRRSGRSMQMNTRKAKLKDGRYIIYYTFSGGNERQRESDRSRRKGRQ